MAEKQKPDIEEIKANVENQEFKKAFELIPQEVRAKVFRILNKKKLDHEAALTGITKDMNRYIREIVDFLDREQLLGAAYMLAEHPSNWADSLENNADTASSAETDGKSLKQERVNPAKPAELRNSLPPRAALINEELKEGEKSKIGPAEKPEDPRHVRNRERDPKKWLPKFIEARVVIDEQPKEKIEEKPARKPRKKTSPAEGKRKSEFNVGTINAVLDKIFGSTGGKKAPRAIQLLRALEPDDQILALHSARIDTVDDLTKPSKMGLLEAVIGTIASGGVHLGKGNAGHLVLSPTGGMNKRKRTG